MRAVRPFISWAVKTDLYVHPSLIIDMIDNKQASNIFTFT